VELVGSGRNVVVVEGDRREVLQAAVDAYFEEDRHFIESVKAGRDTEVPYIEGVKALEITLAAVKSAEEGRVVRLPLASY